MNLIISPRFLYLKVSNKTVLFLGVLVTNLPNFVKNNRFPVSDERVIISVVDVTF